MAPRLSVVVPIYNVAEYLEACLDSLAAQSLTDLEVVMVDDGSTDDSAFLAEAYTRRDPRFRLVRQANAGLGAARNTGTRHATGTYLAFADSDDVVPEHAYELLTGCLDETGSDFASGNVQMLGSRGLTQSPMHRKPLARTRLRTHVTRDRLLLYDRLAPNKVFRRSFWDHHDLKFPEGVLYEDIPVTIPAHFLARSVDVVNRPVYYWRQREGANGDARSITQRRLEPQAVTDRIGAVTRVSRFLAGRGRRYRRHKRAYDEVALGSDIRIFLNVLPEADEAFRHLFLNLAAEFLAQVAPGVLEELPAIMRLKWHLAARRRLPELLEVLAYERRGEGIPTVRRRGRLYAAYPFFEDPALGVPRHVYRLRSELALRTRVTDVAWKGGLLEISGYSHINFVTTRRRRDSVKVAGLRRTGGRWVRVLPVRTRRDDEATRAAPYGRHRYDWAGFSLTIDPNDLKVRGGWRNTTWKPALAVFSRGVLRRGLFPPGRSSRGAYPPYVRLAEPRTAGGVRIVPMYAGGTLRIRVEVVEATVTAHHAEGGVLAVQGRLNRPFTGHATLRLRNVRSRAARDHPLELDGTTWRAGIPLEDLPRRVPGAGDHAIDADTDLDENAWRPELVLGGETVRLVPDDDMPEAAYPSGDRQVVVERTRHGYMSITERSVRPVLTRVSWSDDTVLEVAGRFPVPAGPFELVLRAREGHAERVFPAVTDSGGFACTLGLRGLHTLAGLTPLPAGRWDLLARTTAGTVPVKLCHGVLHTLPLEIEPDGRRHVLDRTAYDQVVLDVRSDLRPEERGPFRQRRLREQVYPASRELPLREAVLFDSYSGKQFSDSPHALHEELLGRDGLEHLWAVRDGGVETPQAVRPVRLWGADWYEALATSRYIVTNAHLPEWLNRRDGQVIVQCWHGAPLKKIGLDITDVQFANAAYLQKVAREAPNWSLLVSPSRFSTPILRRAFGYDGEIIESGYPRNDLLFRPDRHVIAAQVRERLGVPAGQRVILYAPTWRDDRFYGPGRYRLDMRIDLDAACRALGHDHVLLVRGHPNTVDAVPTGGRDPALARFVRDVSAYPELAELLLITDVLVTDYSSLMFDFACTGRPMVFFTYDLEHYRDELRGFYLDFPAAAPGPLVTSSEELVEALAGLRGMDAATSPYAGLYADFRRRYCDLDDGYASARVANRMLELGREARSLCTPAAHVGPVVNMLAPHAPRSVQGRG